MKIMIKSEEIDFELCELLGFGSQDFLVLCFNGVQFEAFGTPVDSPAARVNRQGLVDALNTGGLWPEMFSQWGAEIRQQFKLPADATAEDFKPVVSMEISRVCRGYSKHLYCAIGLFEECRGKIESWVVTGGTVNGATILAKDGRVFSSGGKDLAQAIATAVLEMLRADRLKPGHQTTGGAR